MPPQNTERAMPDIGSKTEPHNPMFGTVSPFESAHAPLTVVQSPHFQAVGRQGSELIAKSQPLKPNGKHHTSQKARSNAIPKKYANNSVRNTFNGLNNAFPNVNPTMNMFGTPFMTQTSGVLKQKQSISKKKTIESQSH